MAEWTRQASSGRESRAWYSVGTCAEAAGRSLRGLVLPERTGVDLRFRPATEQGPSEVVGAATCAEAKDPELAPFLPEHRVTAGVGEVDHQSHGHPDAEDQPGDRLKAHHNDGD